MPIRTMCEANTPGATLCQAWSRPDRPIYTHETHVGLVLATGERNGYDDSDFTALVWNAEKGAPDTITYASTRGWTYPNSASVDATPEVRAAYQAYQQRQINADRDRRALCANMTPTKGKRVRFVRGTTTKGVKIIAGTEAVVFWYGEQREFGALPRGGYKEHGRNMRRAVDSMLPPVTGIREGYRVGVTLASGENAGKGVFTAATNVLVIADDQGWEAADYEAAGASCG